MLELLNEYARYVNITWGREAAVKVHCSTGQVRVIGALLVVYSHTLYAIGTTRLK